MTCEASGHVDVCCLLQGEVTCEQRRAGVLICLFLLLGTVYQHSQPATLKQRLVQQVPGNQNLAESVCHVTSLLISILMMTARKKHVPYRDSKLTRLLQGSLGGSSRTAVIVNLPPGDDANGIAVAVAI